MLTTTTATTKQEPNEEEEEYESYLFAHISSKKRTNIVFGRI